MIRKTLLTTAFTLTLAATPALAAEPSSPASKGQLLLVFRARIETVDDAAIVEQAQANTVRLRLGYRTASTQGWSGVFDVEGTTNVFGEDFNSTANGRTAYPMVVDPDNAELNQAYVQYAPLAATRFQLGRQRLIYDNQRFFGNSGWRQNEQTFDAATLRYAFDGGGPVVRYAYLDRVQRVFGNANPNPLLRAWDLNANLLNVAQALPLGTLVGYAYFVRNDTVATASTRTLGARWTGAQIAGDAKFGWTLEYAKQDDYANNPASQSASYRLIEPTLTWHGVTFKIGDEVMGGNGHYGFATPFATLHAFDGWADRFLTTPVDGVDDRYLGANGNIGKAGWTTVWHDFHADRGGRAYGTEVDAMLSYPLARGLTGLLKFADYRSDGFSTDEKKLWAGVEYKF